MRKTNAARGNMCRIFNRSPFYENIVQIEFSLNSGHAEEQKTPHYAYGVFLYALS